MPKLKTNKAAAKRFSVTGTGKLKRSRANKQHILGKKSPKRKRKLRKLGLVSAANHAQVKKMLPYE
ncbi:MAG: 50S ribosomal protein L35 [Clostridiales bacterium]|jgi:large subunit ribosomal protein L35|nr:50S ribosomal protein L35 [Clostridiales bacterium]